MDGIMMNLMSAGSAEWSGFGANCRDVLTRLFSLIKGRLSTGLVVWTWLGKDSTERLEGGFSR